MRDIFEGKGYGYKGIHGMCMIKCFDCGRENYAMSVSSGYCAWCGFNANKPKVPVDNADELSNTNPKE